MKKLLIVLGLTTTILACNSGSKTGTSGDTTTQDSAMADGEGMSAADAQ